MTGASISKFPPIKNTINLPADKSISHRAVMISSISNGTTTIKNFLNAEDCLHTLAAFENMGIDCIRNNNSTEIIIKGQGLYGLKKPSSNIYLGNSGTSMRLILGILAGQKFQTTVTGDASLCKRPMERVTHPLIQMGAQIYGKDNANFAPIKIKGGKLNPINYNMPVASAQVKSCIMLASLYADGESTIKEENIARDHTERMFNLFNAKIKQSNKTISIIGGDYLATPGEINIPGDISSAAFFIALALLLPDSELIIKNCGINPTRTGFIESLKKMGADINIFNIKNENFEPCADIRVKSSRLRSITIEKHEMPKIIDEIPVFSLIASMANGTTVINGISELRVKETDRVSSIVTNLKSLGADITVRDDSIVINGPAKLKGAKVKSFKDHRTAMSMLIAGALAEGKTYVCDLSCINTSFPGFLSELLNLKDKK